MVATPNTVVGKRLKAARSKAGMTQEEAARAADCTQESIANYEAGNRLPRLEIAVRLAKIYSVSMDSLYGEG